MNLKTAIEPNGHVTEVSFQDALALHQQARLAEAEAAYAMCLEQGLETPDLLCNLGSICRQRGAYPAAHQYLSRAIQLDPNHSNAHYNLGNLYKSQGKLAEAVSTYRRCLALTSGTTEIAKTAYNLGLTLFDLNETEAAIEAYRQSVAADPNHTDAALNLAVCLCDRGRLNEARNIYEKLEQQQTQDSRIINNLSGLYQDIGKIDQAIATLNKAIELQPERISPRSNKLMALQYKAGVSGVELKQAAQAWGEWAEVRAANILGHKPQRNFRIKRPGTALRVGYVSADFVMHPVGLFLKQIIAQHDPKAVTPILYGNGSRRDEVTEQLIRSVQEKGGGFRDVRELDDLTLAKQIRQDEIDILVDLSGHTAKSRLAMFALRPAPVQISWLGYFATTGLEAIDFIILDPHHAPAGTEAQFTERIIRLPHNRFCYSPVFFAPAVSPAPTFTKGHITFGSFNNTAKLNKTVLATWAGILAQVPDSRLILKWRTFADQEYREQVQGFLLKRGIDPGRIELREASTHLELLEQYADIDIALDPFPFSGGHTSCEALWMGVPVVTLPQERVVSRQTYSFLANIGLTELAGRDRQHYIELAVSLANTPERLRVMRRELRPKIRSSSLCDVTSFTKHLEQAYELGWNTIRLEAALAWASQGVAERNQGGEVGARIRCYREAVRLAPENGIYAANLASALTEAGEYAESERLARLATQLSPERFEPWYNLGNALAASGKEAEAAVSFIQAAEIQRDQLPGENQHHPAAPLYKSAGDAWGRAGKVDKAAQSYQAALRLLGLQPSTLRAELLGEFGEKLEELCDPARAEVAYREALQIKPDDLRLLTDLGNALAAQRRYDEARACYERVIELDPELAGGYSNLGTVFQSLGDNDQATLYHRRALELNAGLDPVWSNLCASMTYSLRQGPTVVREALKGYEAHLAAPLLEHRPFLNDRDPARRLRVGYVSPDFRKHAVAYFALPLLENHDKQQVEVFCYYNHRQHDDWTAAFKSVADHWCDCASLSDEHLVGQIRQDGIDVLVDLAGHTENNRLLTFARKPAPVQLTWMGYVTTTGMSAMDWRVTHTDADPAGCEGQYSERLYRLPGTMWCYRPLPDMPEVSPAPFERKGHITFGSFNRYAKNNLQVMEAWAQILQRVPNTRLILCIPEGSIRLEMAAFFQERGVDSERIDCFAKVSHTDFWCLHGEVDIALDPFPFGGGTTTCETLWLGVPLITCTGVPDEPGNSPVADSFPERFASRMGYAFLNNLGVRELAAATIPEYVDKAVTLANDPARLVAYRQTLRPRMAQAPLTDEKRFAREMEAAYREMWQDWLERTS